MNATTAEEVLEELRKYDFPRAYHTRLVVFGTSETDDAAAFAASTPAESLSTKEEVQDFLHILWSCTSTALDHGDLRPEQMPALTQLELELANIVTTLRGQAIKRI